MSLRITATCVLLLSSLKTVELFLRCWKPSKKLNIATVNLSRKLTDGDGDATEGERTWTKELVWQRRISSLT